MENRRAFTLLETVIALSISCSIFVISLYNLKNYQQRIEEQQTLKWFKDTFKSMLNYCYLNKRAIIVHFDSNKITFNLDEGANNFDSVEGINKAELKKRILPKTLKVSENFKRKYRIAPNGEAPPMTVTFKSTLTNRTYIYKIQMNWGEIVEQKK